MPFETVRDVIEREIHRPVDKAFAWIGEQPMAAASIGQVHAARLPDGREVVVKVQYPGVGNAIRADMQNTAMIASFARMGMKLSPIRMTADPTAIAEEVTAQITDELDYRTEAANQARSAPATKAIRSSASPRSSSICDRPASGGRWRAHRPFDDSRGTGVLRAPWTAGPPIWGSSRMSGV